MELQNQDLAHIIVTLTQAKINEGYKMKSSMDDIISSKRSKLTLVSKTWTDIMCFLIWGTKDTTLLLWFPIPLQKKTTTNCVQIEKLFAKHLACILQKCWYSKRQTWDFPGGLLVKNLLSNAEGVGLIPGQGAKIPHALWTKQTLKKRRSNIVTNSKEFWNGSHQIKVLNTHTERKQNSAWVETKQSKGTYSMQLQ